MKKTVELLFCAVLVVLSVSSLSLAAEVTMDVTPGYGGTCRVGRWNPVTISLSNPGGSIDGAAVVSVAGVRAEPDRYMVPVNLPSLSKKQFTVYVPLGTYASQLNVQVFDGDRKIKEINTRYRDAYEDDYVLVSAGSQSSAFSFLTGVKLTLGPKPGTTPANQPQQPPVDFQVGYLEPSVIPDKPAGFDGVDMLVLTDLDTSRLSTQTLDAIRLWTVGGGRLVVCGGADYARLRNPLFDDVLPVTVQSSVEAPGLSSLGAKYGYALPQGSVFVCKCTPMEGSVTVASQDGLPLIVNRSYGLGTVTFLAFDPLSFPLKGWDGQTNMWRGIVTGVGASKRISGFDSSGAPGMNYQPPGHYPSSTSESALEQAALMIKSTEPPSAGIVAAFLLSYLIVLVPVNYAYLRSRRRFERAWVTTPAIIVGFTIAAYIFGYAVRGGDTVLNRVSIIETTSGSEMASLTGCLGIYAPSRARYEAVVDDPMALVGERRNDSDRYAPAPADLVQGETPVINNIEMRQWSGRTFRVQSGVRLKGRLESVLRFDGKTLTGTITNRTGYKLRSCMLCYGDARQQVFDMDNGTTVNVAIKPKVAGSAGGPPIVTPLPQDRSSRIREQVAFDLSGKVSWCYEPVLVGWIDDAPLPAKLKGCRYQGEDTTLALFHLRPHVLRGPKTVGGRSN